FSFTRPSPPQLSTLSLHDALPISDSDEQPAYGVAGKDRSSRRAVRRLDRSVVARTAVWRVTATLQAYGTADAIGWDAQPVGQERSEEHTSELQSQSNLVCRLLLEK